MMHITGNEEDASFHLVIKSDACSFYKTITINHELDYDIYSETCYFPTYSFRVSQRINKIKISTKDISLKFIDQFQCTFDGNNNDIRVWNTLKNGLVIYNPTLLIKPNEQLHLFSTQLYDKYVEYYNSCNFNSINS